ncbi:YigZ family protein [Flavobacteriaceae bacterium]|nr:YigZ family protein [Flavobacteriaceae bacterium]
MENTKDFYHSIASVDEPSYFKEKGSKFYGFAFPVKSEEEVKQALETVKKSHYSARHWCYAYRLGVEGKDYRVNDDGEPSNSAGQPIYGQILAKDLTDVLVVVVRYFGGVKLGVGGLIQAYKLSAQLVLNEAKIIDHPIEKEFQIQFNYDQMNKVMRYIKDMQLRIVSQELALDCKMILATVQSKYETTIDAISQNHLVRIKQL